MIIFKKQLGFALPIAIVIVVVSIIAGGVGYYFYKTSQEGKEKEAVPEEEAEVEKPEVEKPGEYTEFTLTFPHEKEMDFQAKTIFVSEIIWESVPYIQIGLFGESPIIAPYVQTDQLEEFLGNISLNGIIDNIKKKEEETKEAKGVVVITVKKPDLLPQKVICNLEEDSLCGITIAQGAYQVAAGEPYGMSFGGGTFYFKENNIIEGEIDAYYGASILGEFRVKIQEGTTLIEKGKLIEEAERKIKEAKEIQEKEKEISDRDRRRVNDIMLISETLQRYYRDERKYFQSKTIPTGIEPYHLVPTLKDPLTGDPYNWLDNTPGTLTGCDAQHFCLWAELEKDILYKFIVASEKGFKELETQPTKCPCHP